MQDTSKLIIQNGKWVARSDFITGGLISIPFKAPLNVSYARNFLMTELFNAIQPVLIFAQGVGSMEALSPKELVEAEYFIHWTLVIHYYQTKTNY